MPIIISYDDFITQTGDMPSGASQPYQYSGIASNITGLEASDRTIIFTDLPSGLRVSLTQSTEPFDSVFIDIESYNDFILMSGISSGIWEATGNNIFQARYVSSAGFWALGATGNNSPGCILTGVGSATSSILDITFEGINFQETTFNTTDVDMGDLYLERGRKYIFDSSLGDFNSPVYFDQTSNDSWYPIEVEYLNGSGGGTNSLIISGTSYSGVSSSVTIFYPFDGMVHWSGNSLYNTESYTFAPQPFTLLNPGYSWNSTVPNEILSDYTVLASNAGNTGTAVVQLNAAATNGEQFTDLITPLRKLHILFSDNP
jgi:hypothetical protein